MVSVSRYYLRLLISFRLFRSDPSTCNPVMEETLDMVWGRVIREAPMPPTLKSGVDQAEWNNFENKWEQYKKKALPSEIVHPAHLYSCLEEKLKLQVQRSDIHLHHSFTEANRVLLNSTREIPLFTLCVQRRN